MIKLFATDLDGTLLNLLHSTDPFILSMLKEVSEAGAHIVIATGRTMRSTDDFGFQGIPVEAACANGSIVLGREGQLLGHTPIDAAFLEEMIRAFPQISFECVGLKHSFYTSTAEAYAEGFKHDRPFLRVITSRLHAEAVARATNLRFEQSISDIVKEDICKVNTRVPDAALERELKAFLADHRQSVVNAPFNPVMFEITHAQVNKGTAVAYLAHYYGFSDDEVAVYGDGGNDIAMLERFEHAYVPSNAVPDAKQAARKVLGHFAFYSVARHMRATVRAEKKAGKRS